jgi:ABC-type uncharacterized transport system substrate-binding protein
MHRRQVISLVGGVAAWPVPARAQQALPVIGYLGLNSPEGQASFVAGFRKGLDESGFVEGRNVLIEFRWAGGQFERMPGLIADLIHNRVTVIFASAPSAVRAAQAQTATIPMVFHMGEDPIKKGVVASLNRPGANVTGVSDFANQLAGKRLALLRDTVPKGVVYALLVRPSHPNAESDTNDTQVTARALGLDLRVLMADDEHQIDMAFTTMAQLRIGALCVNIDPFFTDRREQIAALAARRAIPTIYPLREFAMAGSLMSYGGRPNGIEPPDGHLRGPDSQGRKTRRPADPAIHKIRIRDQSQDRQGTRSCHSDRRARHRHRDHRMKRREFIAAVGGAAAWPLAARAQQAGKLPTIGFLGSDASGWSAWTATFAAGMRELGWIDGRTVAIEYRWSEGRPERVAEIASEFVRLKADVIVTMGSAVPALKQATAMIPIVFVIATDPLGDGLVASLARPGGNVTGLSQQSVDLAGKRLSN